jgi:uncharacterized protein YndB with AHSA1/START domain
MKCVDINLTRTIRGAAADVYDVWLDPASPGGPWFGSKKALVNAAVDGLFYHAVEHEGREWAHYGRFTRLERGRVIEHTWMSEATKGIETIVTLTLTPIADGTEVTLTHRNVPDDDLGRSHRDGWGWILDMMAKAVERVEA